MFFVVMTAVGVFIFAGSGDSSGSKNEVGSIEIWGTLPESNFKALLSALGGSDDRFLNVRYVEKNKNTYYEEFVEALASGSGPDLILLDHDAIIKNQDKIIEIPYESFSERDFKNIFIEEGELYLTSTGVLGIPFTIDPLIMYWNRNIFQNASIANPPRFWDEFFLLSPKITLRDSSSNIIKSFTALGEFDNVKNAKEIISAFIIQSGNPIVSSVKNIHSYGIKLDDSSIVSSVEKGLVSIFANPLGFAVVPAESAVRFYTEFSNPTKSIYSWNRSLPNSKQLFAAGDLALYFGFASELPGITRTNPNLNFDVATLPQLRDSDTRVTYGKMTAFAIPRSSKDPSGAFTTAFALTNVQNISLFSDLSGLPPVRRDLLAHERTNAVSAVFYDSAIISKAWLDPNKNKTSDIFKNMIDSVTSGRESLKNAVNIADKELNLILKNR